MSKNGQITAPARTYVIYFKQVTDAGSCESEVILRHLRELREFLSSEVGGVTPLWWDDEVVKGRIKTSRLCDGVYFKLELKNICLKKIVARVTQVYDVEVEKIKNSGTPIWYSSSLMSRVRQDKHKILKLLSDTVPTDLANVSVSEDIPRSSLNAMLEKFPTAQELKNGLNQDEFDDLYEMVKIISKLETAKRCQETMRAVGNLSGEAIQILTQKGYTVVRGRTPKHMCTVTI
jgi:hypothetical protein